MSIRRFEKIRKGVAGASGNSLVNMLSTIAASSGGSKETPATITSADKLPVSGIIIPKLIKKIKVPNRLTAGVGTVQMKHHQYFIKHIDIDATTFVTIDKMNGRTYIRSKKTFEVLRSIGTTVHTVHGNYAVFATSTNIQVWDIRTATVVATVAVTACNSGTTPQARGYADVGSGYTGSFTDDCNVNNQNNTTLHHGLAVDIYTSGNFVYLAFTVSEMSASVTNEYVRIMRANITTAGAALTFAEFAKTNQAGYTNISLKIFESGSKINIMVSYFSNNGGYPFCYLGCIICPATYIESTLLGIYYTHAGGENQYNTIVVMEEFIRLPHPTIKDTIVIRRRSHSSNKMKAPQEVAFTNSTTSVPFPFTIETEIPAQGTGGSVIEEYRCAMPMYVSGYNCIMISNKEMRIFQRADSAGEYTPGSLFKFKEKCNPLDMFKPMFIDADGSIYASKASDFNMGEEKIYKLEIFNE